jgi:4-diphosphocytidyl-2-C-methyl-D-erythritol kinase
MTYNSFAKVNIYLKIVGIKDNYHLISSRFMTVNSLFDSISFEKKEIMDDSFELIGKFSCKTEQNLIYKAYEKLLLLDDISKKVKDFFKVYKVSVDKHIPEFAGLGGGSSNTATFLHMCNDIIDLKLDKKVLMSIARSLGADVAFFIDGFESANVEGFGEIVKKYDEKSLDLEVLTPPIKCDTAKVYKSYRENLLKNYDKIIKDNTALSKKLENLDSLEILKNYSKEELNDLYLPALKLYPKLKEYAKKDNFFSGSGSSFFRRKIG